MISHANIEKEIQDGWIDLAGNEKRKEKVPPINKIPNIQMRISEASNSKFIADQWTKANITLSKMIFKTKVRFTSNSTTKPFLKILSKATKGENLTINQNPKLKRRQIRMTGYLDGIKKQEMEKMKKYGSWIKSMAYHVASS